MESKEYSCVHCGEMFWSKNPNVKYKLGHFWMGRQHSQEAKEKLAKSHIGKKWTDEQKVRLREQRSTSGHREKMSKANKGRKVSSETKKLLSQISKKRWQDPEYQEKRSKSLEQYWNKPESHQKRSSISTEQWKDSERRKNHADKLSKFWENNEERLRQSQVMKQNWIDGSLDSEQSIKNSYGRSGYYKGIRMRSQVEIRCAMKLDSVGIKWTYEPKRFYLEELNCTYLPDFYLLEFDTYLEVKYTSKGDPRVDALRKTGVKILLVQNKDLKNV